MAVVATAAIDAAGELPPMLPAALGAIGNTTDMPAPATAERRHGDMRFCVASAAASATAASIAPS
jgi:hypothetical protein